MKKILIITLSIILFSSVSYAEVEKVLTTKVFMGNVRTFPSAKGKILCLVKQGDIVTSTLKTGNWYYITKENGVVGWAHQSLFKREVYVRQLTPKFDFFENLSFQIKTKVRFVVSKPKIIIKILKSKEDINYWDTVIISSKVKIKKNMFYKISFKAVTSNFVRIGCVLYKKKEELNALKDLRYPHVELSPGDNKYFVVVRSTTDNIVNMAFLMGHAPKNTTIQLYNINFEEVK